MTNIGELGKKKLFKNLLDKLNSGKTLSANERAVNAEPLRSYQATSRSLFNAGLMPRAKPRSLCHEPQV